jgi:peptidyl-prolyl cis-trans isomerase D
MLKVFRDNLKYLSWVLWLVIVVFVLFVFVDFGATVPTGSTIPTDAAATVGDIDVTFGEFERSYRQAEETYRQIYGEQFNRELAQQMGLPMTVLDSLVADKILLQEADRMGLRVTDEEVRQAILEYPAFQAASGGFIGEERYRQVLRSNGFTVDSFEQMIRTQLLGQMVRDVLSANLFISDDDVIASYKDQVEQAKIRFVQLPASSMAGEVIASPEEIETYFEEHKVELRIPEQRVVDYLLLDQNALRDTIELSEDELFDYYEANPDEFAQEEQVRARHILLQVGSERTEQQAEEQMLAIRGRLEAGEDFAALATELSDDPGSKAQGGDLGLFARGQMIAEFEEAAFNAQPGEVVGPVRTNFGYHLIRVEERRDAGSTSFTDSQEQIRSRLLAQRAQDLAESKATELAERIDKEGLTTREALQLLADTETGVTFLTTPAFALEDNVPGIGRGTEFSAVAFELDQDEVSEPLRATAGWTILRLAEVREPRIPALDDVRDEVASTVRQEKQLQLATERMVEARQKLDAGGSLDEVAEELGLAVRESGQFGRGGSVAGLGNNPEVASAALTLDIGDFAGPLTHENQALLFEVVERQRFDPQEFETQKEQAREAVRSEKLNQLLASLVTQRRDELGVTYDEQLLLNFNLVPGIEG